MQKFSTEIKIVAGVAFTLILAIIVGAFVQVRERRINDARTSQALGQLWDSLKVNRMERRAEHDTIIANQDTLKQLIRNFVWVLAIGGLYV